MFENKKIFILGMARSGYEVAKRLVKRGNSVIVNDSSYSQNVEHTKELEDLGVMVVLGEHPDDLFTEDFDYLIKNPGITNNHKYVLFAKEHNIPVINEVEVAFNLLPNNVDIVGVTGTNGKTTTSTLIYEVLKKGKRPVHLIGNIGIPVSSILDIVKEGDILVIEISNYQLMNFDKFKTNVSVLTNISPAHVDFHGSYQGYKDAKKRIFDHHTKTDLAIINKSDLESQEICEGIESNKIYFSSKEVADIYFSNDSIYYNEEKIIDAKDIRVKGMHNYENIMCAIVVGKHFDISTELMCDVFKTFAGVEHRIEFVRTINDINIYNDSKATNNKATSIALSAFKEPTCIIMGGLDRGQSFDELDTFVKNVKYIACYGETKNKIKEFAIKNNIDCGVFENLLEATKDAYNHCEKGDVLLLSPACASWDQYKRFEDRGDEFKSIINSL